MIKKVRIVVIFLIVSSLIWYGWQSNTNEEQMIFSSWLEGKEYRVVAEIPSKLEKVIVQEGQLIKKNDILVQLDNRTLQIQLAQAEANLALAQAIAGDVEAGSRPEQISQAKAQVEALQKSLMGAEENIKRVRQQREIIEKLVSEGAAASDQLEAYKTTESMAQATVENLRAQIQGALAQVEMLEKGATSYKLSAGSAQVAVAQQQVELAKFQLTKAQIVSPANGRIEQIVLNEGEMANPGQTVIKIVDDTELHVMIYVPQSQLNKVKIGQAVNIRDENGKTEIQGEVVYIASQGEFTPKNIQTQEERATQVYAVKVLLNNSKEGLFKPGLAVEVNFK